MTSVTKLTHSCLEILPSLANLWKIWVRAWISFGVRVGLWLLGAVDVSFYLYLSDSSLYIGKSLKFLPPRFISSRVNPLNLCDITFS